MVLSLSYEVLSTRHPRVLEEPERSLSAYPAQSVVFAPLLWVWGLGLGTFLGSAGLAALAIATWPAAVLGCSLPERHGRRGPAQWLLRRLAHGRSAHS